MTVDEIPAEPVAWRYSPDNGWHWHLSESDDPRPEGWIKQPLYTAPRSDGLREALVKRLTKEADNMEFNESLHSMDDGIALLREAAAEVESYKQVIKVEYGKREALDTEVAMLAAKNAELRRDLANECERRDDIINCETHLRKEADARIKELEAQIALAWDRKRACKAAEVASYRFQQWVPQQWMDLFMEAYEAGDER